MEAECANEMSNIKQTWMPIYNSYKASEFECFKNKDYTMIQLDLPFLVEEIQVIGAPCECTLQANHTIITTQSKDGNLKISENLNGDGHEMKTAAFDIMNEFAKLTKPKLNETTFSFNRVKFCYLRFERSLTDEELDKLEIKVKSWNVAYINSNTDELVWKYAT